jgi:FAD/FMN-containing dehydrogenase
MTEKNQKEWSGWSGDIRFIPETIEIPEDEDALVRIIKSAADKGRKIRAVGSSHSCSAIFETSETLLSLEKFKGFYGTDPGLLHATLASGMTVHEAGIALHGAGRAMENTGHIDKQAIAGAISTGTHGAGKKLSNLSGQVTGLRIVDGKGAIKEYSQEQHPEIMRALRVSLGAAGIITRVTLKTLPAYMLHRRQYCAGTDDCLYHLDQLMEENRNFCFYWYPRRDDVSIRLWNPPGEGTLQLPFAARLYKEYTGWSKDVLPTDHQLKYNELEYALDIDKAVPCFNEIRARIKARHRHHVGWRLLYRPVAGDDTYLSNAYGGDKVAITIHQNATLPYQAYFDDIEPVLQAYGGRPHWGKKHRMTAAQLEQLYPMWDHFHKLRREMDPQGIFLNNYLNDVFIKH